MKKKKAGESFLVGVDLLEGRSQFAVLSSIRTKITYDTWTKMAVARDRHGRPVRPTSPEACRWCVDGWVAKESNKYGFASPILLNLLDHAAVHVATHLGLHDPSSEFCIATMSELNDSFSFQVILQTIDTALEYLHAHGVPSPP